MHQTQVGHYHRVLGPSVQLLPGIAIVSLLTALQVKREPCLKFGRGLSCPHSLALTNSAQTMHSSDRSFWVHCTCAISHSLHSHTCCRSCCWVWPRLTAPMVRAPEWRVWMTCTPGAPLTPSTWLTTLTALLSCVSRRSRTDGKLDSSALQAPCFRHGGLLHDAADLCWLYVAS